MNAVTRYVGVAIAICSWIAVSNHCAFSMALCGAGCQPISLHQQDADAMHCPFHSKPAKQKEPAAQVQCCKSLRAVVFAKTKTWTRDDSNFSKVEFYTDEQLSTACSWHNRVPVSLDTGPPEAHSFAELILQRSLLTHAPPLLA